MHCIGFPAVVDDDNGSQLAGEVYDVDDETLAAMDRLESNGRMYQREERKFTTGHQNSRLPFGQWNRETLTAWIYIWLGDLPDGDRVKPRGGILNWNRKDDPETSEHSDTVDEIWQD